MRLDLSGGSTGLEGSRCSHAHAWRLVLAIDWGTLVLFYVASYSSEGRLTSLHGSLDGEALKKAKAEAVWLEI